MSLRRVMTAFVAMLAGLALAGAASLILLTTYLHRTTESMGSAVEGVRLAEALQVDLLTLYRLSDSLLLIPAGDDPTGWRAAAYDQLSSVPRRLRPGSAG